MTQERMTDLNRCELRAGAERIEVWQEGRRVGMLTAKAAIDLLQHFERATATATVQRVPLRCCAVCGSTHKERAHWLYGHHDGGGAFCFECAKEFVEGVTCERS